MNDFRLCSLCDGLAGMKDETFDRKAAQNETIVDLQYY